MYREADKALSKIQSDLTKENLKLDNTGFDEFHALSVKTITTRLMKRLKKKNERAYWGIALIAYMDALEEARKKGFDDKAKGLKEKWLLSFLDRYNKVTGYLYNPEAERKRLRLSEAINTAIHFKDRALLRKEDRTFFNLWFRQTKQYMIDVVDGAETQAWEDVGVEYAQWVTAQDEKVCGQGTNDEEHYCAPRDGKIYKLSEFPSKPHYNCRCRKVPMPKGWKPKN